MVAIVAGNGLGLFNTSLNLLGGAGVLGGGVLGQGGGRSYINAATGNLILQVQDELLSGRSLDLAQVRTYNSLGQLTDGDGDGWRWDGEHQVALTGAVGAAGSAVMRTGGDGHQTVYIWDGSRYVSAEGAGAHDTIVYETDSATQMSQWVWTEGSTRLTERYSATTGRLASRSDASGNVVRFDYDAGGRLATVTDGASGQRLELIYTVVPNTNLTRLNQVNTYSVTLDAGGQPVVGPAVKEVEYGYDGNGRLTTVTTDLTPQDATDDAVYVTAYAYEGASTRVTSITQSDGTVVAFSYYQDETHRIKTVIDASGVQTFTYDDAQRSTQISFDTGDGVPKVWTYVYDGASRLIEIDAPAPQAGETSLVTTFHYDDAGGNPESIDTIVDARGNGVIYRYDAQGNRVLERDALGNTVTRTFDADNQLLTETHYAAPDPNGLDPNGTGAATDPLTTRYVYDDRSRLRFVVSVEGRVTEHRYSGTSGLLTRTIQYTGAYYDVSVLAPDAAPSETDLTAWAGNQDPTQVEAVQYDYDLRGNLARQTNFAAVDATGAGVPDAAATVTEYVYDGHGRLLQTIAARGAAHDQRTTLTSFAYDGLGRETSRTSAAGTQNTMYNGVARTITVTDTATGLIETRTFDDKGRLISVEQNDPATSATNPANDRTTLYVYDAAGRLRMTQDAQGNRSFNFYDALGRLQYKVDGTGAVCGYAYNADGQMTAETCYANTVSAAAMSAWVNTDTMTDPPTVAVIKTSLTIGADGGDEPCDLRADALHDRTTRFDYDEAGRLIAQTDAANVVTVTVYDGASRITAQETGDRVTRYFYDRDGLQIGVVDPLGYLTEQKYDAAGRPTETIQYTTRAPAADDVSAPVWIGVTDQTFVAGKSFSYRLPAFDADGDLLAFSVVGTLPSWLTFDAATATLSGTPPVTQNLAGYDVTVRADDGRGKLSDVTVHLGPRNTPPIWTDLPDVAVAMNTANYHLTLPLATDPETPASQLTYAIDPDSLPPGLSFDPNPSAPTIQGTPTTPGTYLVTVQVSDTGTPSLSIQRTFTITVTNNTPTWSIDPATVPAAYINSAFDFHLPPAVDPDGEELTYQALSLPPGLAFDVGTLELTGKPTALGAQTVTLAAQNPLGEIVQLSFAIDVTNRAPTWQSLPATPAAPVLSQRALSAIDYTPPPAVDPDGQALTYSASLPNGLTLIDPKTGRISGSLPRGTYTVTLTATDPNGGSVSRSILLQMTNNPPVYNGGLSDQGPFIAQKQFGVDVFFSFGLNTFGDPDGDPLTYTAVTPSWLHFSVNGGLVFSGHSGFASSEDTVTVTATDSSGASTSRSFTVTVVKDGIEPLLSTSGGSVEESAPPESDFIVVGGGNPPRITSPSSISVAEGTSTSTVFYTATAEGDLQDGLVTITFSGTDASAFAFNTETGEVRFRSVPNYETKNVYSFSVLAQNAGGGASQTVTVFVTDAAPAFTSGFVGGVTEGASAGTQVYTAVAADPAGGAVTYSLSGADAGAFTINSQGLVTINTIPDYETKPSYNFTVVASDGVLTSTKAVTVAVTDVAPTFASGATASVTEGAAAGTTVYTAKATDPVGGAITYTLGGADANAFVIDSGTGAVAINAVPNYESKSVYSIVVTASDGTLSTSRAVTVAVTNVAPAVTSGASASVVEGSIGVAYAAVAADPGGGALTYSLSGTDAAKFTVNSATGAVSFAVAPNFETPGDSGANNVYDIVVTVSDGVLTTSRAVAVTVINAAPVFSGASSASVVEGASTSTVVYQATAADPAGGAVSYGLSGVDAGALTIDSTGAVRFNAPPDFETKNAYTFTVLAGDGAGAVASRNVTLNVLNAAPVITSASSVAVIEGASTGTVVYTASARDPAGGAVSFSLSGSDADAFTIDSVTGAMRFKAVPRFAVKSSYSVVVLATDDANASASLAVTLKVSPTDISAWRPANPEALHSYRYYDGQGRLVGSVDTRGFLTETVYDDAANTQRMISYLAPVTVGATDTPATLRQRALAAAGAGAGSETSSVQLDDFGRVATTTGVDGTATRNEYDAAGRLARQVSADGTVEARATRTRYDAFGEATGTLGGVGDAWLASDPARTLDDAIARYGMRYQYDSLGRRTGATDANGHVTLYYYDSEGRLAYSVNAAGEVTNTLYDSFGEATSQRVFSRRIPNTADDPALAQLQQAGGGAITAALAARVESLKDDAHDAIMTYAYDQRGQVAQTTDAEGFVTTNSYDAFGQRATQTRSIRNAVDSTPAVTTATQYDYDLDGRLLSQTSDVGGVNLNTQTAYDAYGRVIRTVDGAGRVTRTDYEDSGRTVVVTDPLGRAMHSEYDAFGRMLITVDALGQATRYVYDDAARRMSVTTPEGITVTTIGNRHGETLSVTDGRQNAIDASKATTRYTYNQDGQVLTVTDALDHVVTVNTYDASGRLATTTDARGTVTQFTYDEVDRIVLRQVDPPPGAPNGPTPLNLTTKYEFDALGRQVTVTEGFGTAAARVTSYRYDRDGRVLQAVVDPDGLKLATTYGYDGLGDTVQVAQGTVDDPNQQVTQYLYDKLGRRVREIAAPSAVFGPGPSSERDLTTEYRYDAAGRLSRKVDADGHSTWFVYDAAGELTYTIDAAGGLTRQFYDADGRVLQVRGYRDPVKTTALGDVVTSVTPSLTSADQRSYFVYDNDGRQRFTLRAFLANSWVVSETRYDANGNVLETRAYDKVVSDSFINGADTPSSPGITVAEITGALQALGYTEQGLGSEITDDKTLAYVERTRFAYDADNRLRFTVDAMGDISENTYDAAGNVVTRTRYAARPTLSGFDEAAIDGAVDRSDPNNQVTYFAYDRAGRLRFAARQMDAPAQGYPAQTLVTEMVYDALGRVVQTIDYANSVQTAVDYRDPQSIADALLPNNQDRISAAVYDAAGRRVYSVRALEVHTLRDHMQYVVTRQVFDAMGHVIQNTAYADPLALAELAQATLDGAVKDNANPQNRTTRFAYDAAGRLRFTVAPDGSFSETVYDALGQVTEQRAFNVFVDSSTPITEAALVHRRAARHVGDGITRGEAYTYDALGRVLATTDAAGYQEISTYDAFGNRRTFTDKSGNTWTYIYDLLGRVSDEMSPPAVFQLSNETAPPATPRQLRTHYTRDAFGNVTARGEALGTVDMRITLYQYDNLNRQTMMALPNWYDPHSGKVVARDALPLPDVFMRTLETKYDAFGNVVRTRLGTGPGANDVQYEYKTYNNLNQVVHDIDALGGVSYFIYNPFGEQTSITRFSKRIAPVAPGGADALWTAYAVETALGDDPLKRTITTFYDNLGRKADVTQPSANYFFSSADATPNSTGVTTVTGAAHTRYDYDVFGDIVHEAMLIDTLGTGSYNGPGTWRDSWHYFDVMGRETLMIDALGYQTARSYDALGNLKQVTEYATAGSLGVTGSPTPPATPATSPADRLTVFKYDALNRQTGIERTGLRSFHFDASGHEVNDVATVVTAVTYDAMGRVRTQTDALGNVTTTQYDALGRVSQVTEPARQVAAAGAVDPLVNQVTAAPVTTFTYNAFGQVVTTQRSPGGGAGAVLTTKQSYDAAGNLISAQDANGNVKNFQVDYAGRVILETENINATLAGWKTITQTIARRYAYDKLGRRTDVADTYQEVHWNVDGSATLVAKQTGTRSVYNAFGEMTDEYRTSGDAGTVPDALAATKVTHYDYDNTGRVVTKIAADGVTALFYDLAGDVTREERRGAEYSAGGSIRSITSNARITEFGYDVLGRTTIQRLPSFTALELDNSSRPVTPYTKQTYDRWGNVLRRDQGNVVFNDTGAASTGVSLFYEYNVDNQVLTARLPADEAFGANGAQRFVKVSHQTRYDLLGRAVEELDVVDNLLTSERENTVLRSRTKAYDAVGQLVAEVDATGLRTEYVYDADGNKVGTRNAQGGVFVDTFDANGNVLTHSALRLAGSDGDPANGPVYVSGSLPQQIPVSVLLNQYQYDQANRRVASGDVGMRNDGTVRTLWSYTQYDERSLGIAQRSAAGATVYAEFDALGNKTRQIDANTVLTASGQLDPNHSGQDWHYDTGAYTLGRLASTTAAHQTTQYAYTAFGQLANETYTGSRLSAGNDRTYTYDANGLLTDIVDHSVFGTAGSAGGADFWSTTNTTHYEYTERGERARETYGQTGSRDVAIRDAETGRIFIEQESLTPVSRTTRTTYDNLGRIKAVSTQNSGGPNINFLNYNYDELGNRREIVASYSGGASDHWYTYDAEGRITLVDGELQGNQIVAVEGSTVVTYDALGRRRTVLKHEGQKSFDGPTFFDESGIGYYDQTTWQQDRLEQYTYNDLGYLTRVQQQVFQRQKSVSTYQFGTNVRTAGPTALSDQQTALFVTTVNHYDLRGALFDSVVGEIQFDADAASARLVPQSHIERTFRDDGQLFNQITLNTAPNASPSSDTFVRNNYDNAGVLISYFYDQGLGQNQVFENTYTYAYTNDFGGYKEVFVTASSTQPDLHNATTASAYNARGELVKQTIDDPGKLQNLAFLYDNEGHILEKTSKGSNADGRQDYFYAQGHEVAVLGSGVLGVTQIDNGYTPVSSFFSGVTPGMYVVNANDTLGAIAQLVYGDAALWYVIADANNLNFGPNEALPPAEIGKSYRLPSVTSAHSNADTFTPYNPVAIIGNNIPTPGVPALPPPACTGAGAVVANLVVVAVTMIISRGLGTVLTPFLGPMLGYGIGAAVGDAAGQLVGNVLQVRNGFSGDEVLAAGLNAALTAGFAESIDQYAQSSALLDPNGNLVPNLAGADFLRSGSYVRIAADSLFTYIGSGVAGLQPDATSALGNLATQEILQKGFGNVTRSLNTKSFNFGDAAANVVAGAFDVQSGWIFNERNRNWTAIASSVLSPFAGELGGEFGERAGNAFNERMHPHSAGTLAARVPATARRADNLVADNSPISSGKFDPNAEVGDGTNEALRQAYLKAQALPFVVVQVAGESAYVVSDAGGDVRVFESKAEADQFMQGFLQANQSRDVMVRDATENTSPRGDARAYRSEVDAEKPAVLADKAFAHKRDDQIWDYLLRYEAAKISRNSGASPRQWQWELGPRGERIPTAAWDGAPLRALSEFRHTNAVDLALAGNYEAAEIAENLMCPGCHVIAHQDPRRVSVGNYVNGYIEHTAWAMAAIGPAFAYASPAWLTAGVGGWELGTNTGEAFTGKASGLHIANLFSGQFDAGRPLSFDEWQGRWANTIWGWSGFAVGALGPPPAGKPPAPPAPPAPEDFGRWRTVAEIPGPDGTTTTVLSKDALVGPSAPASVLDEGVVFARKTVSGAIGKTVPVWDPVLHQYNDVPRPPVGWEHVVPQAMQSYCEFGATAYAEELVRQGVAKSEIYLNQFARILGPGKNHVSLVWQRGPNEFYLADPTVAQFRGKGPEWNNLRTELIIKGYVRLTDEVANIYAQGVNQGPMARPIGIRDLTQPHFRWDINPGER